MIDEVYSLLEPLLHNPSEVVAVRKSLSERYRPEIVKCLIDLVLKGDHLTGLPHGVFSPFLQDSSFVRLHATTRQMFESSTAQRALRKEIARRKQICEKINRYNPETLPQEFIDKILRSPILPFPSFFTFLEKIITPHSIPDERYRNFIWDEFIQSEIKSGRSSYPQMIPWIRNHIQKLPACDQFDNWSFFWHHLSKEVPYSEILTGERFEDIYPTPIGAYWPAERYEENGDHIIIMDDFLGIVEVPQEWTFKDQDGILFYDPSPHAILNGLIINADTPKKASLLLEYIDQHCYIISRGDKDTLVKRACLINKST